MRAALISALALCAVLAHAGPTPQRILTLDVTKTDTPWSLTATRGESIYIRADTYYRGTPYTNLLGGWLWYATSAADSTGVRISSSVSEPGSVWFLLDSTNSLGLSTNPAAYFAQIILTNATILSEWSRGTFTNRNGGGITGIGVAPTAATFNASAYSYVGVFPTSVIPSTASSDPHAVTNGGARLTAGADISLSSTAISNGAAITISYTGLGASGGVSAATATGIAYAVTAEWASTGTASKATTVTGAQSSIIAAALTNAAEFATAAQGVAATNAQARVGILETNTVTLSMTNGAEWGSHTGLVTKVSTNGSEWGSHTGFVTRVSTNGAEWGSHTGFVTRVSTNGAEWGSHANFATNAGGAGAGYYAMSNGAWTAFSAGAGGTANAVTNGGVTINGEPITNGASFSITGGGGGGGLSNIVVAGVYGTYSGSGSNLVASVSLAALAGAGVTTNGQPVTLAQLPASVLTNAAAFVATNDARYLAALTNSAAFATAAQGIAATNAQARVAIVETNTVTKGMTNGAEWGSHTGLVTRTMTNEWEVGTHTNLATLAQGVAGTNAQARVAVLETNAVSPSQLGTATNAAIIDATNRVAGVGYLLPASTNAIGAAFLASKGGVTNGGATLVAGTDISLSSTALSNGAAITISYTGGGSTGGISASTATNISYAVTAEWATTGTASKATTVTGAQSNIIAAALTNAAEFATAAQGVAATNAQARVGILETNSVTPAQLTTATNAIDATFIAAAGGALTSDVSFAAAPACYQLVITNNSPLSWTNTWMPTSKVSRVTLTSTGTTTFVWNWPTQQDAGMRFALDMTGMPSVVFPAGAIYLVNGVFTNTTTLGKSNYVSVIHDCNTYQIMAITNTIGTWGTP